MSIQSNFPSIKPSLLLDFANTKKLDSRVTFTRSTTATYYDGVTTAKAEENLILQSQTFDNASWTKAGGTATANSTTAPDGTTTADTFTEDTATSTHNIYQTFTSTNALAYTWSVYVKANGRTKVSLNCQATGIIYVVRFDLTAVTATNTSGTGTATITDAGNGWYRITATATSTASGTGYWQLNLVDASNNTTYTGDGTSGVFLWGAQLEQRSSVTAYTATTTQAITNYIPVLQTAASGVPRFDHNPTTDESLGLLIEEARTNLAIYSEDLSNAAWSFGNATLSSNTAISPGGTQTADQLVTSAATGSTYARENVTLSAGSATLSVYLKSGGVQFAQFLWAGVFNGTDYANFDLVNGTVTAGTYTAATITAVGNGWYRCTITSTVTASVGNYIYIAAVPASNSARLASYTGNGWNSLYIWGVQLEQAAFATSYIPTVASTVTRNADSAQMTGTNFSSWFSADQGTLYAEFDYIGAGASNQRVYSITNANGDGYYATRVTSTFYNEAYQFGAQQASLQVSNSSLNTAIKNAFAIQTNNFAAVTNAATPLTDTSGLVAAATAMYIGTRSFSDNQLNGHIRKIAYYPIRVTNAQLQALTS